MSGFSFYAQGIRIAITEKNSTRLKSSLHILSFFKKFQIKRNFISDIERFREYETFQNEFLIYNYAVNVYE